MKHLVLGMFVAIFALLLTASALARDIHFVACTLDARAATLQTVFNDDVEPAAMIRVGQAFGRAAQESTAEELVERKGFQLFISYVAEQDKAVFAMKGPPTISDAGGGCVGMAPEAEEDKVVVSR